MTGTELVKLALEAREHAYTPYSHFAVGAALLTKDGKVYQGCNIENAAFSPTNCAERTAFFTAVYQGEREFSAIAVVGGPEGQPAAQLCTPCGVCRQVMREFCDEDFIIYLGAGDGTYVEKKLSDLLPMSFTPKDLEA
jgi:cytidine deaminase